jgi:transposase
VVWARFVAGSDRGLAGGVGCGRPVGLVAGDRGRFAGGGEKGGAKVARTLTGKRGSRFHLAVEAAGWPLEARLAAGNENERRHLLPLVDALAERGIKPAELWADRGYASAELEQALRERGITPRISQPRKRGEPIPAGTPVREVWRGKKRRAKAADPHAHQRWPIERTNAWLRNRRRIATRRDRKPELYEAFLQLAMILILTQAF